MEEKEAERKDESMKETSC